jgi:hypothetical protein
MLMIMLRSKIKLFLAASFAASLVTVSSCSKVDDFGNMNTNPTVPLTPLTSALLTQTLSNVGSSYVWDQGGISTVGGLYCQYFSETQYTDASAQYSKPTFNWDGYYAGNLKDLQTIIDYNSDPATAAIALANGSNANQIATARILKAYITWFLTDNWGDIPYNGIFSADANGVIPYTSQQEIYSSLFTELSEAVAQFDDGAAVKGDILFDGDITMWKKFANSLHALMALRLSKKDATTGAAEFNAALSADGGVFEEGENAIISYPGGNFNSPIYNYYNITSRKDYAVSEFMTDLTFGLNDDRGYSFATTNVGFPFGLTRDDAIDFSNSHTNWAKIGGGGYTMYFNESTTPVVLISAAEIYLARAEAAYLGWTGDDISGNYYAGIAESYKQWDVYSDGVSAPTQVYTDYIAQDDIALGTEGGNDLEKICTQEYLAHYPNGWMGWADWRRTGYPVLTPSGNSNLGGIPRRFPYGPNEYSLNPTNVGDAAKNYTGGSQSSDSQLGRVWWDAE